MNQANESSSLEATLTRYGIEIGFLISGFFGSLLLVSKNSARRLKSTVISVIAGTACANYLTPVALSVLPETVKSNGKYAVAFALGFMGLKGLEILIDKHMTSKEEQEELSGRQADKQTGRQADKQTGKQANKRKIKSKGKSSTKTRKR